MTNSRYIRGTRKRGLGATPLIESDITAAQSVSATAADCARKLGVTFRTYRKYAKMYGLYEKCLQSKKGTGNRFRDPRTSKIYPIEDILAAKPFPQLTKDIKRIKHKLVRAGVKLDHCDICGENEKRITDNKSAVTICFKDGDKTNTRLNNIEFVC